MTTLGNDDFNRANGSGWGNDLLGNTWSGARGTTTYTIDTNKGAAAGNSSSYCVSRCGTGTSADTDQVVTVNRVDLNDVAGLVCRFTNANNYYACTIGQFSNFLTFDKQVAGTYTNVAFGPNTTYALATTWKIRMRVIGTSCQVKIWDASGSEPGSWTITTTDSSLTGAGGFGIYLDPWTNTATKLSFDDYLATDGSSGTTSIKDIVTRFRLKSANQLKDVTTRFRLRSADTLKDVTTRLRLRSADQLKDVASRLRLSALTRKDVSTRLRLGVAGQFKDIVARFRIRSANQLKDIVTRFRIASASQLRDVSSRFRQASARQLKDISARIRLSPGAFKDIATRFRLNQVITSFGKITEQVIPLLTGTEVITSELTTEQEVVSLLQATHTPIMPTPNTSVNSKITVLDENGQAVTDLSTCTVVVHFPDGTTQSLSLGAGVVNIGSGVYKASYTTKSSGIILENWSIVAADHITVANFQFDIGVGY